MTDRSNRIANANRLAMRKHFRSISKRSPQCEEKLEELFEELMAELAQKEAARMVTKIFVKLKFADFTRTTVERAGLAPSLGEFRSLLAEAFAPHRKNRAPAGSRRALRAARPARRGAVAAALKRREPVVW